MSEAAHGLCPISQLKSADFKTGILHVCNRLKSKWILIMWPPKNNTEVDFLLQPKVSL